MQTIHLKSSTPITVETVVRTLPNKREVIRGVWSGQPVYAKKFFGKQAHKYAARDAAGVALLQAAGIATPTLLFNGEAEHEAAYILIFAEILQAENAQDAWQHAEASVRFALAELLVLEIAKHHNASLLQTDLYLKNFLVQNLSTKNQKIYTLDGDGIKSLPNTFNNGQITLRNLSALLSKFDVLEIEKWLAQLLKIYADARGWETLPRLELLQHLITMHRNKVSNNYANKKVFRTCTDVQFSEQVSEKLNGFASECKKLNGFLQTHFSIYTWVASAYAQYADLSKVEVLDSCLNAPAFKGGNTCTVGLMQTGATENALNAIDAQKIVVKRYNIKSVSHAVARAVRKTRAAVSWSNAHRLQLLGLPTAAPIALIETRYFFGLFKSKSYFLSAYIHAPDVSEYFANERDVVKRDEAIKQIVELFYRLYLLKISHGDLKASNIKMANNLPVLIDLDSMQQHIFGLIATHKHARDLRRFMRNWQQDTALLSTFKNCFKEIYANHQPLKLANID